MPQMAPISWLLLFVFFSSLFLGFNIINYFSYISNSSIKNSQAYLTAQALSWKW